MYSFAAFWPCRMTMWLRLLPACTAFPGGFFPVSVRVPLVEPVRTAAVGWPRSRTRDFWWKISGVRSVITRYRPAAGLNE